MHVASHNFGGGIFLAWAKNKFWGSCEHNYAYRKMVAVKMVFVRFGGKETNLWGQLPASPVGCMVGLLSPEC